MAHPMGGRIAIAGCVALTLAAGAAPAAGAQGDPKPAGIANGGFEEQDDRGRPVGWVFPAALEQLGYRLRVATDGALVGEKCAALDATAVEAAEGRFGNLMQSIDATSLRGKRVRFRAAVRTGELSADGRAQLWFRVDRSSPDGQIKVGAFDNMQDRPITASTATTLTGGARLCGPCAGLVVASGIFFGNLGEFSSITMIHGWL